MIALLSLMVFLLVALMVYLLAEARFNRTARARVLQERLEALNRAAERNPSDELELLRDELLSEIPALNRLLSRSARIGRLQRYLGQADMKMRAGKFLLVCAFAAVASAFTVNWLTFAPGFPLLAAIAGAAIPVTYVSIRRGRRFRRFEKQFPEVIDLLARAIRAGHTLNTALEMIGNEMAEPVRGEFRKLFEELRFGMPLREALLNLAERVPLVDVKFFVTAVMIQRETGGNLAEILDKLSYVIRERFKILRQVRVFTAQGRLTLLILMALPPLCAGAMALINPEYVTLLVTDSIGHALIMVSIIMQAIGFFLIRSIIRIEV